MTKIYNKIKVKENRRKLRKAQTDAELIFWMHVKDRKFHGHKLRRQYSVGSYIADFYCSKLKLVIEIDGEQHFEDDNAKYDLARTEYFKSLGINVKRYTNSEIKNNLSVVMDDLFGFCGEGERNPPHPNPLLSKERG
ncbi:MAG: endonuclease domain-containing protein [Candidatus Moraniibacteriota bacterium]